jgi:hypothetical protein
MRMCGPALDRRLRGTHTEGDSMQKFKKLTTLLAGAALVVGGVFATTAASASPEPAQAEALTAQAEFPTPIRSQHNTNLCLTLAHFNAGDGASVHMYECNGADTQQWIFTGHAEIKSKFNGKCLDTSFGNHDNGASVAMFTCNGQPAQMWYRPYGGAIRTWQSGNRCLEISGANYWTGAALQLWDCPDPQAWQRWWTA